MNKSVCLWVASLFIISVPAIAQQKSFKPGLTWKDVTYLSMADTGCIILPKCKYEAPALFRVDDLYFGLFSGCTSWDSNRSRYAWGRCLLD